MVQPCSTWLLPEGVAVPSALILNASPRGHRVNAPPTRRGSNGGIFWAPVSPILLPLSTQTTSGPSLWTTSHKGKQKLVPLWQPCPSLPGRRTAPHAWKPSALPPHTSPRCLHGRLRTVWFQRGPPPWSGPGPGRAGESTGVTHKARMCPALSTGVIHGVLFTLTRREVGILVSR